MRLVLDTNTALSGLLWQGTPGKLIDAAKRREVTLFSSAPLLVELHGVMARAKFADALTERGLSWQTLFEGYAALVQLVKPAPIAPVIVRDPADDAVLACALAAQADLIVSGDKHLLDLGGTYQGIRIVTPAETVQLLNR
ncbi:MAG: putative toxin-antitoxin system toxin component, PIN family [Rhodocyclales bacterium]|nr:MAG: putative toxin-antitoxin system toxin component, PIN family [Rhodocyclales bacterium]